MNELIAYLSLGVVIRIIHFFAMMFSYPQGREVAGRWLETYGFRGFAHEVFLGMLFGVPRAALLTLTFVLSLAVTIVDNLSVILMKVESSL